MISKQNISREMIVLFLLLTGLWIHAPYMIILKKYAEFKSCSFNPVDFFEAIIILEVLANSMLTFSAITGCFLLLNYDIDIESIKIDRINTMRFFQMLSIVFYFINGILTNVTFFKSDYVNGKLETCSDWNTEIIYRLYTFSFAWIIFILYAYLICGTTFIFFMTFFIALKESNLCGFCNVDIIKNINCFQCFSSRKRISPQPNISSNDKNIQTENDIFIPISSIKNDIKPFICMICMTNTIDVILKPCYHICMCNECINKLSKKMCPCCNMEIKKVKNIYLSNLSE